MRLCCPRCVEFSLILDIKVRFYGNHVNLHKSLIANSLDIFIKVDLVMFLVEILLYIFYVMNYRIQEIRFVDFTHRN
jgi:hypothetical protein